MQSITRKLMMTLMAVMAITGAWAQASAPSMPEAVINLNKFNGVWQANLTFTGDNLLGFTGSSVKDGKTQWSGYGTFHKMVEK